MILEGLQRSFRWSLDKIGTSSLLSLILIALIISSLLAGLSEALKNLDLAVFVPLSAFGMLSGWWFARTRLSDRVGSSLTLTAGILVILVWVGRLSFPLRDVLATLVNLTGHGWPWQLDWTPLLESLVLLGASFVTLVTRTSTWIWGLFGSQPNFDPVATILVWSFAIWFVCAWASWTVRRWQRPLLGVLPAGGLLAASLNYVRASPTTIPLMLGGTLLLIALTSAINQEKTWQAKQVDYFEEIRFDITILSVFLTIVLVLASMLTPYFSIRQIADLFHRQTISSASPAGAMAESLGFKPLPQPANPLDGLYSAGLPRQHLLGSGPELKKQIVMLIQTDDHASGALGETPEASPPRYYWRSLTYDHYSGRGWSTNKTSTTAYRANQWAIKLDDQNGVARSSGYRLLSQTVVLNGSGGGGFQPIYAAGLLAALNQDYSIAWRPTTQTNLPGNETMSSLNLDVYDIFGALTSASTYQAESIVPMVGTSQLRNAGEYYPTWVQERYLQLPAGLPERVLNLALDLTATQPTPYNRARSIESFLRTYPYTLDMPDRPPSGDIVDYFLFTRKRGYCDYYASAMVVLARAAGLPARLAIGYASGTYDALNDRYIVTAADAHSWPEIFFPGYGWIEFEPTAGLPALDRPQDEPGFELPEVNAGSRVDSGQVTFHIWQYWLYGGIALLLFLLLGLSTRLFIDIRGLKRLTPRALFYAIFRRLCSNGQYLAVPSKLGDTPYEFATSFALRISNFTYTRRFTGVISPAAKEIRLLTEWYALSAYSPHPPDADSQTQAILTWRQLRWRLWLARLLQKTPLSRPRSNRIKFEKRL